MSYSFDVRKPTKAQAKEQIAVKMQAVVETQPVHARDKDQAVAAACAMVDILPDVVGKDVVVSMSGSLSGKWEGGELVEVSGASCNVYASLSDPVKA